MRALLPALSFLAAVAVATPARAEEGEWRAGGGLGYAAAQFGDRRGGGPQAGLHGSYGLLDWLALKGHLGYSRHGLDANTMTKLKEGTGQVWSGALTAEYTLDILKLVPTIEAGLGLSHLLEDDQPSSTDLLLEAAVGLDYLWSRQLVLGFEARYHLALTDPRRVPLHFALGPRITWIFQ